MTILAFGFCCTMLGIVTTILVPLWVQREGLVMSAQLEILRRIADRGLALAQRYDDGYAIDIWQHMLDEIRHTVSVWDECADD